MSLMKVSVSSGNNSVSFGVFERSGGYFIKNAEGLGPVQASIVTSPYGTLDGAQYHSSRREMRNLVFTVGYRPDYGTTTIESLRRALYLCAYPKAAVRVEFEYADGKKYWIDGVVESVEPVIFSEDPEVSISILCMEPDFRSSLETTVSFEPNTNQTVSYSGDTPVGVLLKATQDEAYSSILMTFKNTTPFGTMESLALNPITQLNDVLELSTVDRNKGVWNTRAGVKTSLLYSLQTGGTWIKLYPGNNVVRVDTTRTHTYQLFYTELRGGL